MTRASKVHAGSAETGGVVFFLYLQNLIGGLSDGKTAQTDATACS